MSDDFDDFDDADDFDESTVAISPPSVPSPMEEASAAYLIVLAGSRVGEMIRVGDRLTIGRGSGADFRVDDTGVSKEHVALEVGPDGAVIATDLESRNGTFINGRRLDRQHAELRDGDKIHVGSTTILKFSFADQLDESFQQQMYDAALRDQLTGLFNRRRLLDQLEAEVSFSSRHGTSFSLILLDIDHFKRFNDDHGHLVGDQVLRGVGALLKRTIRREDVAARYGGEEFAVLCRATPPERATTIAERIRTELERERFAVGKTSLSVTISAGIAGLPEPTIENAKQLIEAADKALYQAKADGRNCVRLARL